MKYKHTLIMTAAGLQFIIVVFASIEPDVNISARPIYRQRCGAYGNIKIVLMMLLPFLSP